MLPGAVHVKSCCAMCRSSRVAPTSQRSNSLPWTLINPTSWWQAARWINCQPWKSTVDRSWNNAGVVQIPRGGGTGERSKSDEKTKKKWIKLIRHDEHVAVLRLVMEHLLVEMSQNVFTELFKAIARFLERLEREMEPKVVSGWAELNGLLPSFHGRTLVAYRFPATTGRWRFQFPWHKCAENDSMDHKYGNSFLFANVILFRRQEKHSPFVRKGTWMQQDAKA